MIPVGGGFTVLDPTTIPAEDSEGQSCTGLTAHAISRNMLISVQVSYGANEPPKQPLNSGNSDRDTQSMRWAGEYLFDPSIYRHIDNFRKGPPIMLELMPDHADDRFYRFPRLKLS